MSEFRIFKELSIQEYQLWQIKLQGEASRIDLYVTGLPLKFGLKFRDIKIGKKNYKCNKLELKVLNGNVWKKIIQHKIDKKIKIRYNGVEFEKESVTQCFQSILKHLKNAIGVHDLIQYITANLNQLNLLPIEKRQQKMAHVLVEEICLLRSINTNKYYVSFEIEQYTEDQLNQKLIEWAQLLKCQDIQKECIVGSYPDFISKNL